MTTSSTPSVSLGELAASARPDRNRAVDGYRVAAMAAVALGHWLAIAVGVGPDGELQGGNALGLRPGLSWITWIFQVMPLFFVVGGFASAMSLDSHAAGGGRPQDWVAARLRRMVTPATALAATWLALLVAAAAIDQVAGSSLLPLVAAGAVAAAIPLWFLANYTIDTAIAPYLLPRFRRAPLRVVGGAVAVFGALEALRLAELDGLLHYLPAANWVLGWLLFQVAGFAWRDGLLPTGWRLAVSAAGLWAAALVAVTFGPWPLTMVHFPGVEGSPTHPPSLALMLFGAAYAATAVTVAPAVSRFLAANQRVWAAVVGASSVAMSVYLWHMTAAVAAIAGLHLTGSLPTATVGSAPWWGQKLPLIGVAALALAAIVWAVAGVERRALLAPRAAWPGGARSVLAAAGVLSAGVKLWANTNIVSVATGMAVVVAIWATCLRENRFRVAARL